MVDTIRIEPAKKNDIGELVGLLAALFTQEADFTADQSKQAQGLALIIEREDVGNILVMRAGERIVGMVNLLFTVSTAEGGNVILLEDMVIHPDHRGVGLGSQLLRHSVDFAAKNGFLRITLLTDRMNERAIRFYRRHGFELSAMVPMRLMLSDTREKAQD